MVLFLFLGWAAGTGEGMPGLSGRYFFSSFIKSLGFRVPGILFSLLSFLSLLVFDALYFYTVWGESAVLALTVYELLSNFMRLQAFDPRTTGIGPESP
jgi:hypothetical protein